MFERSILAKYVKPNSSIVLKCLVPMVQYKLWTFASCVCWLELVEFGSPKKVGKSVVVVSSNYDGNLSKTVVDNAICGI